MAIGFSSAYAKNQYHSKKVIYAQIVKKQVNITMSILISITFLFSIHVHWSSSYWLQTFTPLSSPLTPLYFRPPLASSLPYSIYGYPECLHAKVYKYVYYSSIAMLLNIFLNNHKNFDKYGIRPLLSAEQQ